MKSDETIKVEIDKLEVVLDYLLEIKHKYTYPDTLTISRVVERIEGEIDALDWVTDYRFKVK